MESAVVQPLPKFEKTALWLIALVVFPLVGVAVEYRSAYLSRRMGDLDVFLRAAWAVRTGADPYAVASDNDWHYLYPPLFAILMTPLADPPPGEETAGYVPYAASVAICYLLNVACLFWSIHVLASALEAEGERRFSARWWRLRWWPMLVCGLPIAHTMMRGQVNILVLAALSSALAGWLRGRNFRAGLWLSLAICIKVIPIYLLVYPLWKRDTRALAGCGIGLLAGLIVIPALVFGPARTLAHYETYATVFFAPHFRLNDNQSRKSEVLGVNATDSVSVQNAIHNWMHPDPGRRPDELSPAGKLAYLLLGFAMTFVTLWQPASRYAGARERTAHIFAGLIVLMTIFSPVCHSHYLLFCVPIVMSLIAWHWRTHGRRVPWMLMSANTVFALALALAHVPGLEILKDRCFVLFTTLPFWLIAVAQLWRGTLESPAMNGAMGGGTPPRSQPCP